ncbi:MAG: hypothetical protein ACYC4L_19570 [Chloroflexota bacterium]
MAEQKEKGRGDAQSKRGEEKRTGSGEMTTEEAGRRGGRKVKQLIEEGKQAEKKERKG